MITFIKKKLQSTAWLKIVFLWQNNPPYFLDVCPNSVKNSICWVLLQPVFHIISLLKNWQWQGLKEIPGQYWGLGLLRTFIGLNFKVVIWICCMQLYSDQMSLPSYPFSCLKTDCFTNSQTQTHIINPRIKFSFYWMN